MRSQDNGLENCKDKAEFKWGADCIRSLVQRSCFGGRSCTSFRCFPLEVGSRFGEEYGGSSEWEGLYILIVVHLLELILYFPVVISRRSKIRH